MTKEDKLDMLELADAYDYLAGMVLGHITWANMPEGEEYWQKQQKHLLHLSQQLQETAKRG